MKTVEAELQTECPNGCADRNKPPGICGCCNNTGYCSFENAAKRKRYIEREKHEVKITMKTTLKIPHNKPIELRYKCRAFVGEEPKEHRIIVEAGGIVRVFDPVSNCFTRRHSISAPHIRIILGRVSAMQ